MCGADALDGLDDVVREGSSPRVRSRHCVIAVASYAIGIISACAEQTVPQKPMAVPSRDHLRVCGADYAANGVPFCAMGSSPRVRSRPFMGDSQCAYGGIISACAEQTDLHALFGTSGRDHLRVCGADLIGLLKQKSKHGSSPRVRSRLRESLPSSHSTGIISACAEQTTAPIPSPNSRWDHLRVCGADLLCLGVFDELVGSSPRVRSRHERGFLLAGAVGIISACAEQTMRGRPGRCRIRDHLRVCGADEDAVVKTIPVTGSSPRVRSRQPGVEVMPNAAGIISACAEQTL